MDIDAVMRESRPVGLEEMLAAREQRARRQKELLAAGAGTLVSFTLNIPGPRKTFPLAERAFAVGTALAADRLGEAGIPVLHSERHIAATGCEAFLRAAASAPEVKRLMMDIEDGHPLGRLFDIDVLDGEGNPLRGSDAGRPERQCLVCDNPVWRCARNRSHSADELARRVARMLKDYFDGEYADAVACRATRALLYEVAASPKPGLVDRVNNGAHRDMDIFTFIDSATALTPYFRDMTLRGIAFDGPAEALLPHLRQPGRWAEKRMFAATGGVNTHKGAIFSLGVACAGLGVLHAASRPVTPGSIAAVCAAIAGKTPAELAAPPKNEAAATHGQNAYAKFGLTGVRGEAAAGFPNARDCGYRVVREMMEDRGCSANDAGVVALLHLMAQVDDTNIVARADADTLAAIQKEVAAFLEKQPDTAACLDFAAELDRRFIEKNISPGGCADLLALAYFFLLTIRAEAGEG